MPRTPATGLYQFPVDQLSRLLDTIGNGLSLASASAALLTARCSSDRNLRELAAKAAHSPCLRDPSFLGNNREYGLDSRCPFVTLLGSSERDRLTLHGTHVFAFYGALPPKVGFPFRICWLRL